MLELELYDSLERLDVDQDINVEFEQNFNLHDFEHVEGTKSWRFRLPKTPKNKRLTGWVNLPEQRSSFENNIKIRVVLGGTLWKVGLLYFINDVPGYWNVHFAGEAGLLKQLIGDRKLTDFEYPTETIAGNMYSHAKIVALDGPEYFDYTFFEVYTPKADLDPAKVPYSLNPKEFDFGTGTWLGFLGATNGIYAPLAPFPYVKSVLTHIGNELEITFGGELWVDEEFSRLCFFNTLCLNTLDGDERPFGVPTADINIGNHLPDCKLSELLIEIGKLFNQQILYDDRSATITFLHRPRLFNKKVDDTLRYKVDSMVVEYKERRTYSLSYEYNEDDVLITQYDITEQDLSGIDGPEGSEDVVSSFGTLPTKTFDPGDVLPVSSLDFNDENPKTFLFYRGIVEGTQGAMPAAPDVPYGSSDLDYTPRTGQILDNYSLKWKGQKGLYEVWWRPYLEKLKLAKVLRLIILFTMQDVANFRANNTYAFVDYVCLVEELKLRFKGNRLEAEAQVLKL